MKEKLNKQIVLQNVQILLSSFKMFLIFFTGVVASVKMNRR